MTNFTTLMCLQYTINGQFQFEGSNYRRKERKRGKHILLHGDVFNQQDSIEKRCIKLFSCRTDDGVKLLT